MGGAPVGLSHLLAEAETSRLGEIAATSAVPVLASPPALYRRNEACRAAWHRAQSSSVALGSAAPQASQRINGAKRLSTATCANMRGRRRRRATPRALRLELTVRKWREQPSAIITNIMQRRAARNYKESPPAPPHADARHGGKAISGEADNSGRSPTSAGSSWAPPASASIGWRDAHQIANQTGRPGARAMVNLNRRLMRRRRAR